MVSTVPEEVLPTQCKEFHLTGKTTTKQIQISIGSVKENGGNQKILSLPFIICLGSPLAE